MSLSSYDGVLAQAAGRTAVWNVWCQQHCFMCVATHNMCIAILDMMRNVPNAEYMQE